MSKWFLKIGNSRLLYWDGAKRRTTQFPKHISELWFQSVVPKLSKEIKRKCRSRRILCREVLISDFPFRPAYTKNIGIDRLLNIYAAAQLTKKNFVVMDVGTALTVDFFSQKKKHLGGWITAGPQLLAKALGKFTAKLPQIKIRPIRKPFGLTTQESLLIGQREFLHGMMLEAVRRARQTFGNNFEVFLTGGGMFLMPRGKERRIDDLALIGLKKLAKK